MMKKRLSLYHIEDKPRNQTFQFIKALLIIMVVDDHCGQKLGLMTSLFPYNSFYMPMFVFVSGYFFKEDYSLAVNVRKAVRKVLMPYLLWSFVGWGISFLLTFVGLKWWNEITINKLIELLFLNPLVTINGPMWYAITYFWLLIVYSILNTCLKDRNNALKECVLLVIFAVVGGIALSGCRNGFLSLGYSFFNYRLFVARLLFYFPFFHFGFLFHKYIEKAFDKSPGLLGGVALSCVVANIVLVMVFGGSNIVFVATAGMSSFKSDWLPYVTSITGILFWYSIMRGLSNTIGRIRIIDFVANNTFIIMAIHLLMADIPGFFAYFKSLRGYEIQGFDKQAFVGSAWYRFYENTSLYWAFICGITGSLLVALLLFWLKSIRMNANKR